MRLVVLASALFMAFGCTSALWRKQLLRVRSLWVTTSPRQVKCRRNPNPYTLRN